MLPLQGFPEYFVFIEVFRKLYHPHNFLQARLQVFRDFFMGQGIQIMLHQFRQTASGALCIAFGACNDADVNAQGEFGLHDTYDLYEYTYRILKGRFFAAVTEQLLPQVGAYRSDPALYFDTPALPLPAIGARRSGH